MSKLLIIIASLAIIATAFFTTLWLTAPQTPADLLAKHAMPDDASIRAAAALEGLSELKDVQGLIDDSDAKRWDYCNALWLGCKLRESKVTVLVLVDGKSGMIVQPKERRPDVAKALGLSDTNSLGMGFKGDTLCPKGIAPRVVVVSEDKRFNLGAPAAPCP